MQNFGQIQRATFITNQLVSRGLVLSLYLLHSTPLPPLFSPGFLMLPWISPVLQQPLPFLTLSWCIMGITSYFRGEAVYSNRKFLHLPPGPRAHLSCFLFPVFDSLSHHSLLKIFPAIQASSAVAVHSPLPLVQFSPGNWRWHILHCTISTTWRETWEKRILPGKSPSPISRVKPAHSKECPPPQYPSMH